MRHAILATGMLVFAVHLHAQSASAATAAEAAQPATATTPPLTKTVAIDANDSPMVRAAKRAVASRVNPGQHRVIALTSTNTRGRVAIATGPAGGPALPPPPTSLISQNTPPSQQTTSQREAAQKAAADRGAATRERLKQLQNEEAILAAEAGEPYGHAMDEDQVEKRLTAIAAERKKLLETPPPK